MASSSPYQSLMNLPLQPEGGLPDFANADDRFKCPICNNIIRGPVQTECGHHTCKQCLDNYLAENGEGAICPKQEEACEPVTQSTIYPDFALKKQIEKLLVFCKNRSLGCNASVPWKELEDHMANCRFCPIDCPNRGLGCTVILTEDNVTSHLNHLCNYRVINCRSCDKEIRMHEYENHMNMTCTETLVSCPNGCDEPAMKRKDLANHCARCPKADLKCKYSASLGCEFAASSAEEIEKHAGEDSHHHFELSLTKITALERKIQVLEKDNKKMKRKFDDALGKVLVDMETIKGNGLRTDSASASTNPSNEELINMVRSLTTQLNELKSTVSRSISPHQGGLGISPDIRSMILKHERYLEQEQTLAEEINHRVQCLEGVSYDGTLLWKISNFSRRKEEAKNGTHVSIYSQPFYTGRNGYKMCLRAYLNGDGVGKDQCLSIFFVMLRGEYDALLRWPFTGKITFMLIDQEKGQRHIQDVFRADAASASFKRPVAEQNIATGCPRFASHEALSKSPYNINDTIFIRAVADSGAVATRTN